MNQTNKNRMGWVFAVVAGLGALAVLMQGSLSHGQGTKSAVVAGAPHYTVIETEGHNLIVTDNVTNTLYFYTIDPGQEIGSDLKLRGSMDLSQVGKDTLKPKKVAK